MALSYLAPYRWIWLLAGCLLLAESGASLGVPWLAGRLTAALLGDAPAVPSTLMGWLLALFAAQALFSFASTFLMSHTGERIVRDLRADLYDHFQSLPIAYYHQRRTGDVLGLLIRDVQVLGWFLSGTALTLLPLLFTFLGAWFLMVRIDPLLGFAAGLAVPFFILAIKWLGRRIRPLAAQIAREQTAAIATAEENLNLLPAIKAFTREELESERYRRQLDRIVHLTSRQLMRQLALGPITRWLGAAGILLMIGLASRQVIEGSLTPSELVSLLLYGLMLTRPVGAMASTYGQIQQARASLGRLHEALQESAEPDGGRRLHHAKGAIAFEDVTFAYPGRPPVLEHASFAIRAGETVAFTGENGAGKSTLAHLILRFHHPREGRILLDGRDIAGLALKDLRRLIGLVPQHILLLNATVRENIAYGESAPSPRAIEEAARAACAHDFITRLPEGYDTLIGEGGVRLSGGQKQRIALARALLKDPPILILDEATAMYDPQGEQTLLRTLEPWLRGRTVILITHRPASLALADRILRVAHGKVVEDLPVRLHAS